MGDAGCLQERLLGPLRSQEGLGQDGPSCVILPGGSLHVHILISDTALKYADNLLEDVLGTIDTNRDGRISYSGARCWLDMIDRPR